ncbi:MAG: hypothetical protein WCO44_12930 [Bacteroidota bacterium]
MKPENNFFKTDGHLTEEGIALWVDSLAHSATNRLPEDIAEHLENCTECKAAVVEIRHLVRELKLPEFDRHVVLKTKETAYDGHQEGILRRLYSGGSRMVRIAAVGLVLLTLGTTLGLFLFNRQHDPDRLFTQNFIAYTDIITEKSTTWEKDTTHQLLYSGLAYYHRAQYDSAAIAFRILYRKDPSADTVAFYLANALLGTQGKQAEAIVLLKSLIVKNVLRDQSRWYLALAELKSHNSKAAKTQLDILIATSGDYRQKATDLFEKIN